MENYPLSDLHPKQHCESPSNPAIKYNFDKPLFPNEMQKQLSEDKKIGESFFKQGELRLLHGDSSGIQFFDLAIQLDPNNYKLHYEQGLSLLEFANHKGHEKTLLLAAKRFKQSVKLLPAFFEGWHSWADTLYCLGKNSQEHHFFLEAQSKYKQAIAISKGQPNDILADLYWNYGSVLHSVAKKSKEPSDALAAVDCFEKALPHQQDMPLDFWHEYGEININLGLHLNDLRFFDKGIFCFKNAVSLSMSSFDSWIHLAKALSTLYHFTHDEEHFTQANDCFTTAAQLNSKNISLWTAWAELLKSSGFLIKDVKRLHSAVEKCHRAHSIEEGHIATLCIWVEALSYLGLLTEKVGLIHDAQNKILLLVEDEPSPEALHAYGVSLFCLGKYFNDLDYYYQAIEKFQEGLSQNRTLHQLWHSLGYTYTRAALIDDEDGSAFEKAFRFFQKALSLQGNARYYFDCAFCLLKWGEQAHNEPLLKKASDYFEMALNLQKDSVYLHANWLFNYGVTLDLLAGFHDDGQLYMQALEILNHVLIIEPEHPKVHYHLALTYTHYAEISEDPISFQKAIYHYKLASKKEQENDQLILDWAITLASYGDHLQNNENKLHYLKEAEFKMMQAAKLGNIHAFYHLACVYSLLHEPVKAMYFLKKAQVFDALPSYEEILEDDWLENLRSTKLFEEFISNLETRSSSEE
jgi:hypothetical protein